MRFIARLAGAAVALAVSSAMAAGQSDWLHSRRVEFAAWRSAHPNVATQVADLKAATGRLVAAVAGSAGVDDPPAIYRVAGAVPALWDGPEAPKMTVIPAGSFTMGSPPSERLRADNEGPQHRVTIGYALAVSTYPITRDEYAAFIVQTGRPDQPSCFGFQGEQFTDIRGRSWRNPGFTQSGQHPATCIGFDDASAYVKWLSRQTGHAYRLLSDAEYEYARRAGTTTAYWWGDDVTDACQYANGGDVTVKPYLPPDRVMNTCSDGIAFTAPVGSFRPNAFGLYDISGNVWTWVADCYADTYAATPVDGSPHKGGNCERRVVRSGSWIGSPQYMRSARRYGSPIGFRDYSYGLRVARVL